MDICSYSLALLCRMLYIQFQSISSLAHFGSSCESAQSRLRPAGLVACLTGHRLAYVTFHKNLFVEWHIYVCVRLSWIQVCLCIHVHLFIQFSIHVYTSCGIAFKMYIVSFIEQILPGLPHGHFFQTTEWTQPRFSLIKEQKPEKNEMLNT